MSITLRHCNLAADFPHVSAFLTEIHQPGERFPNWLQPRWEYAVTHAAFDETATDRIGIWEEDGRILAVATYELRPGPTFFQVRPGCEHLRPAMLDYAERHLAGEDEDGRYVALLVPDFDADLEALVRDRGYEKLAQHPEPMSMLTIPDPFPPVELPDGFQLKSLADENDILKINRVMWRGFNHEGDPPETEEDLAGRRRMQTGPNFRKELTITVHAPDGNYAAFAGLWYDPVHRYAYVEPVATDPDYRRLGLGRAAVLEGVRRCGAEGARVAYVGSGQPFYEALGFRRIFTHYPWIKYLG